MRKKKAQPLAYSTSPAEGNIAGTAEPLLGLSLLTHVEKTITGIAPLLGLSLPTHVEKTIAGIAEHRSTPSLLTRVEKTIAGIAGHPLAPLVPDARRENLRGGYSL